MSCDTYLRVVIISYTSPYFDPPTYLPTNLALTLSCWQLSTFHSDLSDGGCLHFLKFTLFTFYNCLHCSHFTIVYIIHILQLFTLFTFYNCLHCLHCLHFTMFTLFTFYNCLHCLHFTIVYIQISVVESNSFKALYQVVVNMSHNR